MDTLLKALHRLEEKSRRNNAFRALFLFDCLLRVTGRPSIGKKSLLAKSDFVWLQETFYGALYSKHFAAYSLLARSQLAKSFADLLTEASRAVEIQVVPVGWPEHKRCPRSWIARFDSLTIDPDEERRLRGYWLEDKHGGRQRIRLDSVDKRLGLSFCERLHSVLRDLAKPKAKDAALRDFANTLNDFIGEHGTNLSEARLNQVLFTQVWLVDLMKYHFQKYLHIKGGPKEGTLPSLQKLWSRYLIYISAIGKAGLWTMPVALPTGNPSLAGRLGTRHRKAEGTDRDVTYTQKLLTPVPLHVTDAEAIEILFQNIKRDFQSVRGWARAGVDRLRRALEKSRELEARSDLARPDVRIKVNHFRPDKNVNAIANTIWAIRNLHDGYVDTSNKRVQFYPHGKSSGFTSKASVANSMGFLSKGDCLLFAALLMSLEPKLTESALLTARICGSSGRRFSPVEIDGGTAIAVLKDRGKKYHEIILSRESSEVVHLLLQLTNPMRQYMRRQSIADWQNLFVYCKTPLGKPAVFPRGYSVHSAFRKYVGAHKTELGSLAKTITLPQIRASAGVLAFIESLDITKMASVLGNETETALRDYLPDSIWHFFAERWIRIFQNLLISRAVHGTKHQLAASDFSSMTELNAFLTNHSWKELRNTDEPDSVVLSSNSGFLTTRSHVVVLADPDVWSTMIGLMMAVDAAKEPVHHTARYWAEFARKLTSHVESRAYPDAEIKAIMAEAKRRARQEPFVGLIHGK